MGHCQLRVVSPNELQTLNLSLTFTLAVFSACDCDNVKKVITVLQFLYVLDAAEGPSFCISSLNR